MVVQEAKRSDPIGKVSVQTTKRGEVPPLVIPPRVPGQSQRPVSCVVVSRCVRRRWDARNVHEVTNRNRAQVSPWINR